MKFSTLQPKPHIAKKNHVSPKEVEEMLREDELLAPHPEVIKNIMDYAVKKGQKAVDILQ